MKPELYKADGALRITARLLLELQEEYEFDLVGVYGPPSPSFDIPHSVTAISLNEGGRHLRDGLISSLKRFRSLVKERGYDAVVCVGSSAFLHAEFACLGKPAKTVLWEHMNFEAGDGNLPFRKLAAFRADAIVVLTQRDAANYAACVGRRDVPIVVIPNWVDVPVSRKNDAVQRKAGSIVSAGRISEQKGVDLLVEVASILKERSIDFTWDYFGTGEFEDRFKSMIAAHGLEEKIRLMGVVPDMVERLPRYEAFVLTSRWEGLPMVLLESLSQCTPPIAFDIPTGPADVIVDGVNGFLVEPFDTRRMADAIEGVLSDAALRQKLSSHASVTLSAFDRATILAKWRTLLDSLEC